MTAEHPEIPAEHRIQGFDSVRAYTQDPEASREFLEGALEFESRGDKEFEARGESRGGTYVYDRPTSAGSPARGRSTTSRGLRRPRSTRPGGSG